MKPTGLKGAISQRLFGKKVKGKRKFPPKVVSAEDKADGGADDAQENAKKLPKGVAVGFPKRVSAK